MSREADKSLKKLVSALGAISHEAGVDSGRLRSGLAAAVKRLVTELGEPADDRLDLVTQAHIFE